MQLEQLSARALAAAIHSKKISSLEATTAAIARLEAAHALTNCTLSLEAEEVLAAAKACDQALGAGEPVGPLAGVPLAHMDMFDRKGRIASWGARIRAPATASQCATVLARSWAAGGVAM